MSIEALNDVTDRMLLDQLIDRVEEKLNTDPRWEYVLADLNEARCNPIWDK